MALTKSEEELLQKLAPRSEFWSSLLEDHHRWGLSANQKKILIGAKSDHILNPTEEAALVRLASGNDFFKNVLQNYKKYGTMKENPYNILRERMEQSDWEKKAYKVGDIPVRNRQGDKSNRAICANSIINRDEPCDDIATVVVGRLGYCQEHASEAHIEFERWKKKKAEERLEEENADTKNPEQRSRSRRNIADNDDDDEDDENEDE